MSLHAPTASQLRAADPVGSVWVSANAGTGKTGVLTDRITRLLLDGVAPERILCLTFTKAAAAEMAERLSHRLGTWAMSDDPALQAHLDALFGHAVDPGLLAPARRLFAKTLDTPGGLKIRTIHSFCEALLGRFPLEAGIAPHFAVVDERTAAELLGEARDQVLAQAQEDQTLEAAIAHLAALVDETAFADLMTALSFERARIQTLLRAHGGVDKAASALRLRMGLMADETETGVLAAACANDAFDGDALRRAADALAEGAATDKTQRAPALRDWLTASPSQREILFDTYAGVFLTAKGEPRAESRIASKGAKEALPTVVDILLHEQARIWEVAQKRKGCALADATQALLVLAHSLLQAFESLKADRALLDYDDLILTARKLLDDSRGVSWVHYKLDGGLDHVLVDEAQDTSPGQWDVVKALAGAFFDPDLRADGGTARTVFAVGDEKQSIYSFQGAEPRAFEETRQHFSVQARSADEDVPLVELAESFRSVPLILDLVDALFATGSAAAAGLTFGTKAVRHISKRVGQAGRIDLWPVISPEETRDEDPWDAPVDTVSQHSPPARLAGHIADTIKGWLDCGERLDSRNRPLQPSDVMILVRRRGVFAEEMVRALKRADIPVAGADRMVLTDQIAVMDLIAAGRFVLLPDDDLTLAALLKSPLAGLTDDDLFAIAHGRQTSLWRALSDAAAHDQRLAAVYEGLSALLSRADFIPPYEFYARLLGPDGGRKALLARLGRDAEDPIEEFLNLALDYEREHTPSLEGFLHWVEAGRTEIKRDLEHGRGEVRVMTVHGAKGLQAPIVFLPDTCGVPKGQGDQRPRWDDGLPPVLFWPPFAAMETRESTALKDAAKERREEEYRRLLYVALTRAEDRLVVAGFEGKRKRAEGCWYDLIADALETLNGVADLPMPWEKTGRTLKRAPTQAPDRADKPSHAAVSTAALPEWAHRPAPKEREPSIPLAPSRPDTDEPAVRPPFDDGGTARFQRGRLIHRLLQTLPDLAPDERRAAADRFLAAPSHGLAPDTRDTIAEETLAVISHDDFASLFGHGSRAEVPIVGVVGMHVVSGQVDRLLIADSEIWIVDYKTNRPPPQRVMDVAATYLKQMAAYRAVLARAYADRPVRCALLWTDGPRWMPLPDALLDEHTP